LGTPSTPSRNRPAFAAATSGAPVRAVTETTGTAL
jgi:hypothetical protein